MTGRKFTRFDDQVDGVVVSQDRHLMFSHVTQPITVRLAKKKLFERVRGALKIPPRCIMRSSFNASLVSHRLLSRRDAGIRDAPGCEGEALHHCNSAAKCAAILEPVCCRWNVSAFLRKHWPTFGSDRGLIRSYLGVIRSSDAT